MSRETGGAADEAPETIRSIITKHNKSVALEPSLQVKGKSEMRIRMLGLAQHTCVANYRAMEGTVATHTWTNGCWCDAMLDISGFYAGTLVRETSHAAWSKVFMGSQSSQTLSIQWVHEQFNKRLLRPETREFERMVQRFVLATNVSELVLTPAGLSQASIKDFWSSVAGGMHHGYLDVVGDATLEEHFDTKNIRAWASAKLPFLESLINSHKVQNLGLTAQKIHELEAQESRQAAGNWNNKALMDVAAYTQAKLSQEFAA